MGGAATTRGSMLNHHFMDVGQGSISLRTLRLENLGEMFSMSTSASILGVLDKQEK